MKVRHGSRKAVKVRHGSQEVTEALQRCGRIISVQKKHGPTRWLAAERMHNAVRYFSDDWTADELREKGSSMAIRLLAVNQVLQRQHGVSIMSPLMLEQLKQLGQSYIPKIFRGYKPRRLQRRDHKDGN